MGEGNKFMYLTIIEFIYLVFLAIVFWEVGKFVVRNVNYKTPDKEIERLKKDLDILERNHFGLRSSVWKNERKIINLECKLKKKIKPAN